MTVLLLEYSCRHMTLSGRIIRDILEERQKCWISDVLVFRHINYFHVHNPLVLVEKKISELQKFTMDYLDEEKFNFWLCGFTEIISLYFQVTDFFLFVSSMLIVELPFFPKEKNSVTMFNLQSTRDHTGIAVLWSHRHVVLRVCDCRAVSWMAAVPRSTGIWPGSRIHFTSICTFSST